MKPLFHNFLLLLLTVSIPASRAFADVVVIVSARSAITNLTKEEAANIFLGKVSTFPNGSRAVPIDQTEGTSVRDEFYLKIANKSSTQVTAYWAKTIFTGEGFPPKQLRDNATVKRAVANNPYAIGYINKNVVDNSIRVILEP